MTHGEEPGPETHQDSAVLTYLEGFLMHQVAGGQGATTTQSGPLEQRKNEDTGLAQPIHGSLNQTHSHCGASHHLRKARLLNSEAWKECEDLRRPPLPVNGQCEEHHGEQNGSPRDKGASTLLASLLQSFSSRLQNVNLPQQIIQDLRPPNTSCHVLPAQEEKTESSCPRPASTHLKGFVSKSKIHNRSSLVPYQRRPSSQERFSESPKARHSSTPSPSSESISCAERLKAVAKMVNIRLSPASSPKPSVACSQLALLLSSEAHLQQYTREHALKANLSGRLASERLSAMATQQSPEEKEPSTSSQTHRLQLLHSQSYNSPQIPTKLKQSSSQNLVVRKEEGSTQAGFRVRERRPFERQNRTFQNSSSLLLQLLNSHNPSQRINGQGHLKDERERLGMLSFPLLSDSEQSNPDSSFTKDSSDAESSYSVCSPIDLSLKRTRLVETPLSTSSSPLLDGGKDPALFIPTWNPGSSPVKATMDQMEICSGIKPHHKVTLLQLLLDHKNDERGNKVRDDTELLQAIIPKDTSLNTSSVFTAVKCEDKKEPCGLMCRSPVLLPLKQDSNSTASSRGPPPSQTVPLDLCKSKPTYDKPGRDVAFSASKFLQNLAYCGNSCSEIASSVKTPLPPIEPLSQQLKMNHPQTLLNGHSAPIKKTNVMREETKTKPLPVLETIQQVSEIENLLERRTVLQLLLGNSHQRENVSSEPKPEHERSCSVEPQTVGGPAMDASIKTEPDEDCKTWDYDNVPKQWQNLFESKKSSSCFTNAGIKQEPLSPEANAADGLLCHLLKSQPIQTPLLHKSNKLKNNCDQEFDLQGPTIPKKRKFSMELDLHPRQELSGSARISAGDIETKEASLPSSPPPAPARFPAHEPPETRSFNVLKQLLLSDNCLKEPSHSRPVFASSSHTVLNGNGITRPCYDLQNAHQERRSPKTASFTHDGVHRQTSPHLPRQEPPRTRISHSTIKELRVINGDNQTDKIEPDSPIFTKTNPILYYMLQRSNAHLFKGRERPGDLEKLQTKVHKESFGDSQAFDH